MVYEYLLQLAARTPLRNKTFPATNISQQVHILYYGCIWEWGAITFKLQLLWSKSYSCRVEVRKKNLLSCQSPTTSVTKHLTSWVLAAQLPYHTPNRAICTPTTQREKEMKLWKIKLKRHRFRLRNPNPFEFEFWRLKGKPALTSHTKPQVDIWFTLIAKNRGRGTVLGGGDEKNAIPATKSTLSDSTLLLQTAICFSEASSFFIKLGGSTALPRLRILTRPITRLFCEGNLIAIKDWDWSSPGGGLLKRGEDRELRSQSWEWRNDVAITLIFFRASENKE